MAEQRLTSKTLFLFGGLLIWATHFMFVYSANAVACERGLADVTILGVGFIPFTVMLATSLALLATGYLLYAALTWGGPLRGEPRDDPSNAFIRQITVALTLLSMIAIIWSALPSLIVSPCG